MLGSGFDFTLDNVTQVGGHLEDLTQLKPTLNHSHL